jgi:probable rRNA maturation factor
MLINFSAIPEIYFHYENTTFRVNKARIKKRWLQEISTIHKKNIGCLNYIFCTDNYLLEINKKHLNHNDLTDIITFNYNEKNRINGDIFISHERVKENAKKNKVLFDNELVRVMSHGLLHLIGFNDKKPKEIQEMRLKEEECITLYHKIVSRETL